MISFLVKPIIVSIAFLAGFFLLDSLVINRIKGKKIYAFFIALAYFLLYWIFVYVRLL